MKAAAIIGLVVFAIVSVVVLICASWTISSYNDLVQKDEDIDGKWAQVENQYQRKFDLIVQLVNLTDVYLDYESGTLTAITDLRTRWMDAEPTGEYENASEQFNALASSIIVQVENYPDLKGNQVVQGLMVEIAGTENRITTERMRYNDAVRSYNTKIKQFPTVIIAGMFGFDEREYFGSTASPNQP
ncbi:MAG: LemA family protein [Candidatus Thermoplasmatota archaeon]|jgi:LemA protein|nr:LemA family protein [Candidatus Thermoplasmatota archaeon]